MAPPLHKCFFPQCREQIHKNQLMCKAHWRFVAEEHKQQVWATWKAFREAKTSEEKVEYARLYNFARKAALYDVVQAHTKKRAA